MQSFNTGYTRHYLNSINGDEMGKRLNQTKLAFTVEEMAQELGIGRNLAYEAVKSGEIPSIRIGKRIVIPKSALAKMLEVQVPTAA